MSLWRLEWLRLMRTRKVFAVAGPYVFFGIVGPLLARYMGEILASVGGDVTVSVPPAVPATGILQYSSNVQQIGLLVALIIATGALAFDARPQIATFFRTRTQSVARLVIPRYAVITAAIVIAFVVGACAAWFGTTVLLGGLPVAGMLAGMAYSALYLAFAVAVVAVATAVVRGTPAAVILTVVTLLSLPVLALLPQAAPWLPSHLVGALDALAAGGSVTEYLRAAIVTIVAIPALLSLAVRLLQRREI